MKAKVSKLIARRRRRKFSGFFGPLRRRNRRYVGGRPTRYGWSTRAARHACSIQTRRTASLSRVHAASLLSLPAPSGRLLRSCCRRCGNWPTDTTLRAPAGDSLERNEGAAVGDSPPLVPVSQAGYTVHGRGRRRLLFRPGHCSRRKAPYTAKYISLHLSYRRPGVQLSPSLSEFILDFGTCEVMNNMQYVICNGAI